MIIRNPSPLPLGIAYSPFCKLQKSVNRSWKQLVVVAEMLPIVHPFLLSTVPRLKRREKQQTIVVTARVFAIAIMIS